MKKNSVGEVQGNDSIPGILRKTLAYNEEVMLCHFSMSQGATIPLHNHRASQVGYVVSGSLKFVGKEEADTFMAEGGDSYVFDPYKFHGCQVQADSEVLEVFYPVREEYKDS